MPPPKDTRFRTVSYARPAWNEAPSRTLEDLVRSCLEGHQGPRSTRMSTGDVHSEVLYRQPPPPSPRVLLHMVRWTVGEAITLVTHAANGGRAGLDTQGPPPNSEFLDGDAMVLLKDDHVLMMPSPGFSGKAIERYIRDLLDRAVKDGTIPDDPALPEFEIVPVVNPIVAAQIRREGVKMIELGLGSYRETVRSVAHDFGVKARVWEIVSSLMTREQRSDLLESSADVTGKLVITMRRKRGVLEAAELVPLAESVSESEGDDDVVLETYEGRKVRRGSIVLQKRVELAKYGKTVLHGAAWEAMVDYFRELARDGLLQA